MKTTVIYHSADYDGIFCREIAKHFLGEKDVEYIGWNFGDPLVRVEIRPDDAIYLDHGGKFIGRFDQIYILDLSPDCLEVVAGRFDFGRVVWIDHHKTSIQKWTPEFSSCSIPGCRIDGVAACRLAWQWFATYNNQRNPMADHFATLPDKQDFIDRKVSEPLAVRLAGEYDIWDKRDPNSETFQYALRTLDDERALQSILTADNLDSLLSQGSVAQRYAQRTDASICKSRTWLMDWEGLKFLCVNTARFNSLFFAAKDLPETGHDALLGFCFDGKQWTVSLYHAKHRTELDLSKIAVKYGGGGHRGACGWVCKTLPFSL